MFGEILFCGRFFIDNMGYHKHLGTRLFNHLPQLFFARWRGPQTVLVTGNGLDANVFKRCHKTVFKYFMGNWIFEGTHYKDWAGYRTVNRFGSPAGGDSVLGTGLAYPATSNKQKIFKVPLFVMVCRISMSPYYFKGYLNPSAAK